MAKSVFGHGLGEDEMEQILGPARLRAGARQSKSPEGLPAYRAPVMGRLRYRLPTWNRRRAFSRCEGLRLYTPPHNR